MNAVMNKQSDWTTVCTVDDLIPFAGVAAMLDGEQVAVFYVPTEAPMIYAVSNYDPIGKANVIARGIVGDIGGELVIASPLYKQHFSLLTGQCKEDAGAALKVYPVKLKDGRVMLTEAQADVKAA